MKQTSIRCIEFDTIYYNVIYFDILYRNKGIKCELKIKKKHIQLDAIYWVGFIITLLRRSSDKAYIIPN